MKILFLPEMKPAVKLLFMAFRNRSACLFLLLFLFCKSSSAQQTAAAERYPLLPYPTHLEAAKGSFIIDKNTLIQGDAVFTNEMNQLSLLIHKTPSYLPKEIATIKSETVSSSIRNHSIVFLRDTSIKAEESYRLSISSLTILIRAGKPAGAFRAIETIRQLLPVSGSSGQQNNIQLPCVKIEDKPLYSWRGMHLDVSRHFFSIEYLKKFIDVMALYKMNMFHLHLTDDQGWRVEIKKYPKLTEEGAWRTFNSQDSECMKRAVDNPDLAIDTSHIIHRDGKTLYGGFYTQEQLKDLVSYAASKHINIVPEIDMPGHMMAAINSYPFLSCAEQNGWGQTFSTPICPCKETTFEFAENVFTEIMDIFPGKYIHIGADEVEKTSWASSADCKALMQKEGLHNVNELQSYFVKRMEKYFQSKGRELVGWDEILEGGVSSTAMIMYWRSWVPDAPVKAAKHGNKVVMTPGNPLYFDYPPDIHSLDNIYHFSVVPKGLTTDEAKYVQGAQANIWTEYIPSEKRADYMFMPRMTALAERLWSGDKNYDSYLQRLQYQYPLLDAMTVHYRLPDLPNMVEENVFVDTAVLRVKPPMQNMAIHYTTDKELPDVSSPVLSGKLIIKQDATIKLAAFTPSGSRGDVYKLHYKKEKYNASTSANNTQAGLQCHYYKQFFKNTTALQGIAPDSIFTINSTTVPSTVTAPSFALQYKGYINAPQTGIYTFYLTCDDGGVLRVDDKEVVNNDGLHSAIEKTGQVALEKGLHRFQLSFIEGGGGYKLNLLYGLGNKQRNAIPADWFVH